MADSTYQPKVYRKQGGNELVIASGGALTLEAGGSLVQPVATKTTNYTVLASESGTTFLAAAVDLVFTLPPTQAGLEFTFICHTVSTVTGLQISPDAADQIAYTTSVDNKDLINTAATDVEGDSVTLVGDGVDGWWVKAISGTWAKEA